MRRVRRPSVDVVIPTRDTRELTLRAVESVVADGAERVRCIVVDNASSDGTAEAVAELFPSATLLRNAENVGYARACNQGARAGEGELVLFLNSDAIARPGAVARLADALAALPGHSAATGRLVHLGTDTPQVGFALRGFPTVAAQVALLVGLERYWPTNPVSRKQLMLDFDYSRTQDVDAQPAGACLLVRRTVFEDLGGFDEAFFYWFEDIDLVRRLRRRGPIRYVHDATFEHAGGSTFAQWSRPQTIRARYEGLLRYFAKHHGRSDTAVLRLVVGLLAAVRAVVGWPFDRERARAYREVVRMSVRGSSG
jgi:GT2 family glycosyltransferase